jgi:hypothetical protein
MKKFGLSGLMIILACVVVGIFLGVSGYTFVYANGAAC